MYRKAVLAEKYKGGGGGNKAGIHVLFKNSPPPLF